MTTIVNPQGESQNIHLSTNNAQFLFAGPNFGVFR